MRELVQYELNNVGYLSSARVRFALMEVTATGLQKSIMDATGPVRDYFRTSKWHDYGVQLQGREHRVRKPVKIVSSDGRVHVSTISMYKPQTKSGDPRLWIYDLKRFAQPTDILLLVVWQDDLWVFDASRTDIRSGAVAWANEPSGRMLRQLTSPGRSAQEELLRLLLEMHNEGFIKTIKSGDTAIGHLVETRLGIKANSSKSPDYHGIELKSARRSQNGRRGRNRSTLFAQVANWSKSPAGSSRGILDWFGYERDGATRLNCTVSASAPNSQGLSFRVNESDDTLEEVSLSVQHPLVAVWDMEKLRSRLAEKHSETYWVSGTSRREGGDEYIRVDSVVHTSDPILQQLSPLLRDGVVTMDHLIKESGGRVSERGPLFKMHEEDIPRLMPHVRIVDLAKLDTATVTVKWDGSSEEEVVHLD